MEKVHSEMVTLSELRKKFGQRIRTTAFMSSNPSFIVSFKVFSNIVAEFPVMSNLYSKIIEKAIDGIAFYTLEGWHRLSELDYMFYDEESKSCVAVLQDGKDLCVCMPPEVGETSVIDSMPDKLIVSTSRLKRAFQASKNEFPFLLDLTRVIDSKVSSRADLTKNVPELANALRNDEWVNDNIAYCLGELDRLVDKSAFVLTVRRRDRGNLYM